ncbi:response regulator [bacterium]|nr:response regulator [bacterium]
MKTGLLIVESDNLFRENMAQRMRLEGYEVTLSDQVSETKRLIKKRKIDVVLLSLVELKKKGLDILAMIKKQRPFVEVILINNSESMDLSIKGMKLGAFDDFFLPLDMTVLLARLEEATQRKLQRKKNKKPFMQRYEEMVIAISLAEGGATDLAHEYLNREKRDKTESV